MPKADYQLRVGGGSGINASDVSLTSSSVEVTLDHRQVQALVSCVDTFSLLNPGWLEVNLEPLRDVVAAR